MNDEDFESVRRQMLEWNERLFGMAEKAFKETEVYWPSPAEQSVTGIKHALERTGWEQAREISIYYDKLWLGELGIKG